MIKEVGGRFDVAITPEGQPVEGGTPASRMGLAKTFSGGLQGNTRGTMIAIGAPRPGVPAAYVALDLFEGSLDGREGGFVLVHRGTVNKAGDTNLQVVIAPDSGTGSLEGISGDLTITVDGGRHFYSLRYSIPDTNG